jgi:endonuclease YncB( thermonuclease family)
VIDGDTIAVAGTRVRLHGIDAPETRQACETTGGTVWRCGAGATRALADLLGDRPVTCAPHGRDRYRRVLARCFVAGVDIGDWMVAHGRAVAYRRYSGDYIGAEARAQTGRLGVWSGAFEMPWAWRAARKRCPKQRRHPPHYLLARMATLAGCQHFSLVSGGTILPASHVQHSQRTPPPAPPR